MRVDRFDFPNASGYNLAAVLERPPEEPAAYALFAHCFTCGKNHLAASRISQGLIGRGIAVLRFDFTGLGASEGELGNAGFSSNVADLVAAAAHLRRTARAPAILIGHSLGGAAVLAAAAEIPEARAVVTIAAPSDPGHVLGLFKDQVGFIREHGEGEVSLAGRTFKIRREFLDDVAEQRLAACIAGLRKALLVFHSPADDTVGIDNASRIFAAAKHPKSFVSLADADHLLSRRSDAVYIASVIAAWAEPYLEQTPQIGARLEPGTVVVSETRQGRFQQSVVAGQHRLMADEPTAVGGLDSGPSPYDLLLAALGACTAMTLRLYAERKRLPLDRVSVTLQHSKVHATDCESCENRNALLDRIDRVLRLDGSLDPSEREKLVEIADKCPVHRTLSSGVEVHTTLSASDTAVRQAPTV